MDSKDKIYEEALRYHSEGRPGKIGVFPIKPHHTQYDFSMAYSPGVAAPSIEISNSPEDIYKYTSKGNLVGVISNGTAVLGLGNIGAAAGKPVMEGKAMLFKAFSGIDSFDIEVDAVGVDDFVRTVRNIAPTFGGINLEDIKAPECFEIEKRLQDELDIPVMHDDQHGTAIVVSAAVINAMEIAGKKLGEAMMVINGAGAAAIACARLLLKLGIRRENLIMCDSKGVVSIDRDDINAEKREFVTSRHIKTLTEAILGADIFLGVSKANILTAAMVQSMAASPLVMALANPNPEIAYETAMEAREDILLATGRSDYPNQVNNVLAFPYVFRGALDVRAKRINDEMKMAAAYALAKLVREPIIEEVVIVYGLDELKFGKDYFIPKALDPRLFIEISISVARAAVESGVARLSIEDWDEYREELLKLQAEMRM